MEITRKTEIVIETEKRFLISQPNFAERIFCPQCGELMLTAENCAELLQISRRKIYRTIEIEPNAHFWETAAGIVFICANSFAGFERENL